MTRKMWQTPALSRFGSVAEMTLASDQANQGKCPGLLDDAECAPPGRVGGCESATCGGTGVLS